MSISDRLRSIFEVSQNVHLHIGTPVMVRMISDPVTPFSHRELHTSELVIWPIIFKQLLIRQYPVLPGCNQAATIYEVNVEDVNIVDLRYCLVRTVR